MKNTLSFFRIRYKFSGSSDSLLDNVTNEDIHKINVKDSPARSRPKMFQGIFTSFSSRRGSEPPKPQAKEKPSHQNRRQSLISEALSSGISKFSPRMGKRVATWFGVDFPAKLDDYASNLMSSCYVEAISDYLQYRKEIEQNHAQQNAEKNVSYRFYHVFQKGELLQLVSKLDDVMIIDSYYDHSNWCVLLEKL